MQRTPGAEFSTGGERNWWDFFGKLLQDPAALCITDLSQKFGDPCPGAAKSLRVQVANGAPFMFGARRRLPTCARIPCLAELSFADFEDIDFTGYVCRATYGPVDGPFRDVTAELRALQASCAGGSPGGRLRLEVR